MANQEDLQVITKSKALVKYTFVITSNLTRYPKKYRVKDGIGCPRNCAIKQTSKEAIEIVKKGGTNEQ